MSASWTVLAATLLSAPADLTPTYFLNDPAVFCDSPERLERVIRAAQRSGVAFAVARENKSAGKAVCHDWEKVSIKYSAIAVRSFDAYGSHFSVHAAVVVGERQREEFEMVSFPPISVYVSFGIPLKVIERLLRAQ